MKITQLLSKPQLVEISLDDAEIIARYGEAITFWTWDRQPMDVFMRLASATQENTNNIIEIVKDLILDEGGKCIIGADSMLPTDVLMRAIGRIVEMLGK